MKTMAHVLTRRDRCYLIGRRAATCSPDQAVAAWNHLARMVEKFGEKGVPKFNDLLIAVRVATVFAKQGVTSEWKPCGQPPRDNRRVVVWHRSQPYSRRFRMIVGWWNSAEWRWDFPWFFQSASSRDHGLIYQPLFWRDLDPPQF